MIDRIYRCQNCDYDFRIKSYNDKTILFCPACGIGNKAMVWLNHID